VSDLNALAGCEFDAGQASAVIYTVTALAAAYTRGQGFTDGIPNAEVGAVILTAAARLISDPSQITSASTMGPFTMSYRAGFTAWTLSELAALDRYRVLAL